MAQEPIEEIYSFPTIAAGVKDQTFEDKLHVQPCLIREIHGSGKGSTDFDVTIFRSRSRRNIDKIYQYDNANIEFHDVLNPPIYYRADDAISIYFTIDNNDTSNPLDLEVRIVYTPLKPRMREEEE